MIRSSGRASGGFTPPPRGCCRSGDLCVSPSPGAAAPHMCCLGENVWVVPCFCRVELPRRLIHIQSCVLHHRQAGRVPVAEVSKAVARLSGCNTPKRVGEPVWLVSTLKPRPLYCVLPALRILSHVSVQLASLTLSPVALSDVLKQEWKK